jgi:hypothetical protein
MMEHPHKKSVQAPRDMDNKDDKIHRVLLWPGQTWAKKNARLLEQELGRPIGMNDSCLSLCATEGQLYFFLPCFSTDRYPMLWRRDPLFAFASERKVGTF